MNTPHPDQRPQPRVFISYSHDSPEHRKRTLDLADQLQSDGVVTELDQYHESELQHWPKWCEKQLRPENSDFVLCICTEEYHRRIQNSVATDPGKGVWWEGELMYNYIYLEKGNERFVPVFLSSDRDECIPLPLQGYTRFRLTTPPLEKDPAYIDLLRLLTRQHKITRKPLGQLRNLKETERKSDSRPQGSPSMGEISGAQAPSAITLPTSSATPPLEQFPAGTVPAGGAPSHMLMQTPSGIQLVMLNVQSPAQLIQTAHPKARMEELFEIVTEPAEVAKALFGTEGTAALVPYQVEYVQGRDGIPDLQDALATALRKSKGRLLLAGRGGIGKTREVTELAKGLCAKKWKICIARMEGDARLGALPTLPRELLDARLLFIIDNLHARVRPADDQPVPYAERLDQFLKSIEDLAPGRVQAILIARDEPHFREHLELGPAAVRWWDFSVFRLPELTRDGLCRILKSLAERTGVIVAADEIPLLVENSDRKPETLFINVDFARQTGGTLTRQNWLESEGASWKEKSLDATARYPEAAKPVFKALRLLTAARLPTRIAYVDPLAEVLGGRHTRRAIDGFVDLGLLGLRHDLLSLFSVEQLEDVNEDAGPHWDDIRRVVASPADPPPEWIDDLAELSLALIRAQRPAQAAEVASLAIQKGADSAKIFAARGGARFLTGAFDAAEEDLSAALTRDENDANTYFLRGLVRNMRAASVEARADAERAIALGRDDAAVHGIVANAHYQQAHWAEAEQAYSKVIERGEPNGMAYFSRATARQQLGELAGAETDFSAALKQGINFGEVISGLAAMKRGGRASELLPKEGLARDDADDALAFGLRGVVRLLLGKPAEAEEDLSAALERGFGKAFARLAEAMAGTSSRALEQANQQVAPLKSILTNDAFIYQARGAARTDQGKSEEALADYKLALEGGVNPAEIYPGRGLAYFAINHFAEADLDLTRAIEAGNANVVTHSARGLARLSLGRFAESEADLSQAIALGRNDFIVFRCRGIARGQVGKLAEAEADFTAAIERGDDHAIVFINRAAVRVDLGLFTEAEQDCDAALKRGADTQQACTLRGLARLNLERAPEAEADLESAIQAGRKDAFVFKWRGRARMKQSKAAEAAKDFDEAIAQGGADPQTRYWRGLARAQLERLAEAEEDYTAALDLSPNESWFLYSRGLARLRLERYAEAEADFSAALAAGMDDADTLVQRARCRLSQEKWAEAESDLSAAHAKGHDDAYLQFMLGLARRGLKQYAAAERALADALAKDPENLFFRSERALTCLFRGKMAEAECGFDAVLADEPRDADARRNRALARYGQGNNPGAVEDYTAALEIGSDSSLLGGRAQALLRLGRIEEARKDCAALAQTAVESPDAIGCEASLLLAGGDFDGARARFEEARRAAKGGEWTFQLGLALILGGRGPEALAAYRRGAEELTPGDFVIALSDLEFWLGRFPDRAADPSIHQTASEIRAELTPHILRETATN